LFKLQLQIEQSRVLGADALQAQLQHGLFGLRQIEPWFLSVLNQVLQNHQLRLLTLDAVLNGHFRRPKRLFNLLT
jgi:hypothetical protein